MSAGKKGVAPAMWDVEKLVAMQLAYIHGLAIDAAGCSERVQDVLVTVPAFFLQFECDTIADAVKLAGLHLLAFVNYGAAIVVNYAMTHQFPQQERYIMYDAGTASMRVTIPTFTGCYPHHSQWRWVTTTSLVAQSLIAVCARSSLESWRVSMA